MLAVSEAVTVLSYYELPDKDRPPEEIWGNDDRLIEWFEQVRLDRENPDNRVERIPEADEPKQGYTQNTLMDDLFSNRPDRIPGA